MLKNLSAELVKRDFDVNVLTTNAYSTEGFFLGDKRRIEKTEEVIDGVRVQRLGFRTFGSWIFRKLTSIACRIKYPFNDWIRYRSFGPRNREFIRRILEIDADVIYAAPLPTLNVLYAYKAAKRSGKPLIIIPCYHIFDTCSFYNKIFFKMMREADIIMALSPLERDYLSKEGNIDKNRIIVLPPLPLKERQLEPAMKDKRDIREGYGIKEENVVLYLGQHGVHKRVNLVVEAMQYVWQIKKDTALVIAGGVTDNTKVLKKQAAELEQSCKGNGKVYFIDNFPEEEKEDILRMSDIFISLSEMESFGIVFVEAFNSGLPVIASKNGVAGCIVKETKTGILVEPKCITEVAGAIIELLTDETMRASLSENARREAKTTYHPHRIIDTWEEVIRNVANGS
ncbi:MAG: glycosyltransferase family 4 protein [bacterium]|nr:glycosyltransferase family 4 protein [bacterium]